MSETEKITAGRTPDPQTVVVHDKHDERHQGSVTVPQYQTSLFSFATYAEFDHAVAEEPDRPMYSRGNNPTVQQLEQRLAELQGGEKARCFASGMAAISTAILAAVRTGDHIVCVSQVYGPTRKLLENFLTKFGVEYTFADGTSLDAVRSAVRANTKLFYLESPTSLLFQLQDLKACTELAKSVGALTYIDNTWATPCFQNPFALGVDLVLHSTSKFIGGHSDSVGGVAIGSEELIGRINESEYLLLGGVMTPHTASLTMRGLRTLPLRMERFEKNGLRVAEAMEQLPHVLKVHHPGLPSHPQFELGKEQMSGYSSLFAFETDLPVDVIKRWADHLEYFRIGVSWGGYESLVTVPTLPEGYESAAGPVVRLYIGLEDPQLLIEDIKQAFEKVT